MRGIILSFACLLPLSSLAEDYRDELIPEGIGFVDELISSDLNPSRVFGLVEIGPGEVARYPARFLDYHEVIKYPRSTDTINHWIVASPLNIPAEKATLLFTFFLIEDKQTFAGTPVVGRSVAKVASESKAISQLEGDVTELRKKLVRQVAMLEGLDKELAELRKQASQIAGVEDIIGLKMELAELEGFSSEQESERGRVERLVKIGRKQSQPKKLRARRRELQGHLKEAAKVTAMADRLSARKRNAALGKLHSQIALVKGASSSNREILAQQALQLRKKRRALEAKLGVGASGDQF